MDEDKQNRKLQTSLFYTFSKVLSDI